MNKLIFALCIGGWVGLVSANEGGPALLESHASLDSLTNLQRGARTFVNYCLSCHSASFMRYSRLVDDLGLSKEAVEKNLPLLGFWFVAGREKVGDHAGATDGGGKGSRVGKCFQSLLKCFFVFAEVDGKIDCGWFEMRVRQQVAGLIETDFDGGADTDVDAWKSGFRGESGGIGPLDATAG